MATPEEIAAASAAESAALKEQLAALTKANAEAMAAITDLKTKQQTSSQELALSAIKATCPDVPSEVLNALPESVRATEAVKLQVTYGNLKSAHALKTGSAAWSNAGGIGPSVEAEDAAALAVREQARNQAVQKGDLMGVLRLKSRDTVEFISKHFSPR